MRLAQRMPRVTALPRASACALPATCWRLDSRSFAALAQALPKRCSAASAGDAPPESEPSSVQLRAHALQSAVPMVGFGIVDCIVMTQVGSTIDAVLGATLGISAMTAAAIGLFCSDSCGVLFGGTIEAMASRLGLPSADLSPKQLEMPRVRRVATLGRLLGVQLGVILGSTSLLFQRSAPAAPKDGGAGGA